MFEWIVLVRLAMLGFVVLLGLAHIDDFRREQKRRYMLFHAWILSGSLALFVWLMGWLG